MNNRKIKKLKLIVRLILVLLLILMYMIIAKTYDTIQAEREGWIPIEKIDISKVQDNNVIGYLTFPSLNNDFYRNMPIKENTEIETLATGVGHFKDTPLIEGNVCFAGHNGGTNKNGEYVGYFDKIKNLDTGDLIYYTYENQRYMYKVISNSIIKETDLSVLDNTKENKITLITCVKGAKNRQYRQCVVAERIDCLYY